MEGGGGQEPRKNPDFPKSLGLGLSRNLDLLNLNEIQVSSTQILDEVRKLFAVNENSPTRC